MLAYYDFRTSPYSYDFMNFATAAYSAGAQGVVFVPGDRGWSKLTPEQEQVRLAKILLPIARWFPRNPIVCGSREDAAELMQQYPPCYPAGYSLSDPKQGHMLGKVVRSPDLHWLPPPQWAIDMVAGDLAGRKPVVLTIRETFFKTQRNSNVKAWAEFGRHLIQQGYDVLVVPDTDAGYCDEWHGLPAYFAASDDVSVRLALYMQAACNLGIANGPMMLSFLSQAPMMMFRPLTPGHWETSPEYWAAQHIPVGSQPRWFTPKQRIVWEADTFQSLREHFAKWESAEKHDAWGQTVVPYIPTVAAGDVEQKKSQMRAAMARNLPKFIPADDVCAIVGYGPSLLYTYTDIRGAVCTTSGAHDFLINKGVIPHYHVECDPRAHKASMFTPDHRVTYLIASCCHPDVFAKLEGFNVRVWHCEESWTMEFLREVAPKDAAIGGGGNAGLRALQLCGAMGFRKFALHGFDCSIANGARHAGAHTGKEQRVMSVRCGSSVFQTTPQMVNSARQFLEMDKTGIEIDIAGYGLLQAMVEQANRREAA
jgi:uncharacterized Rossmann fold enzyme